MSNAALKKWCLRRLAAIFLALVGFLLIAAVLVFLGLGPIGGNLHPQENSAMQQARLIGLLMFAYSNDNEQRYPEGNSSTEIFQKLLDGNYTSDSVVFYFPMSGKIKPVAGQKLKPENISFDVTCCVDAATPDELPLVFLTGFKVDYVPGGKAVPLKISALTRSWLQWWNGEQLFSTAEGIAACYKSHNARFWRSGANPDGSISNFVAPDFKPDGKTYRQLTPDGVLGN